MKILTHLSWKHMVSYIIIVIIMYCLCFLGFLKILSFLCCFPAKWACQVSPSSFGCDDALSSLLLMFLMYLRFLKFLKFLMFLFFLSSRMGMPSFSLVFRFRWRLVVSSSPCDCQNSSYCPSNLPWGPIFDGRGLYSNFRLLQIVNQA